MKFLATQKQGRDSDYRMEKKKNDLFKKTPRKADQIWNKYKLCHLLVSDRFTDQTLMIFQKNLSIDPEAL